MVWFCECGWGGVPIYVNKSIVPECPACHKEFGRNDPCPCGSGKKVKKCCL